jgi:hypothetical protein
MLFFVSNYLIGCGVGLLEKELRLDGSYLTWLRGLKIDLCFEVGVQHLLPIEI